jgi:hypothetical protein
MTPKAFVNSLLLDLCKVEILEIVKYNPYHDAQGRFASANVASSVSITNPKAVERMKRLDAEKKIWSGKEHNPVQAKIPEKSMNEKNKGTEGAKLPRGMQVGDTVRYSRAFLQQTGVHTGELPRRTGEIVGVKTHGESGKPLPHQYAKVRWHDTGTTNLVLAGHISNAKTPDKTGDRSHQTDDEIRRRGIRNIHGGPA